MAPEALCGGGLNKIMFTKLPKVIIFVAILFAIAGRVNQNSALAYFYPTESSATLTNPLPNEGRSDKRIRQLTHFFRSHNSPLEGYAADFVTLADKYEIDWKLVPAITGVESTFGKFIPQNSYNAYGWANGNFYFESWPHSIEIVNKTLKEKYIDKGASTVEKIAPIYAPPSKTWAGKVRYFMDKIENFGGEAKESPPYPYTLSL